MIAIGGVIGAGLFVGSSVVIRATGSAAFLTYALCGVLIILVMRMLGEMAAANPSTGAFAGYAGKALGGWAGLFVLAARREAPTQLVKVNTRGVPALAILGSSTVGFLCVIVAWVAPRTVFIFLLNSSGAIILFVYMLIALSQIMLRRRTSGEDLRVRMWFFSDAVYLRGGRNRRRAGRDGVRQRCA